MIASELTASLAKLADPVIAEHSQRFFKTGPGEYGEGDLFLGIRVPVLRRQARDFGDLPLKETQRVLRSAYHEERLCALLVMVLQFERGDETEKERIFRMYLRNTRHVNNWDLVDLSAHKIVGAYLADRDRGLLDKLARSASLWERRIGIISTYHFIKNHDFEDTLRIAEILLADAEDLIQKAVGWMLREVGNRDAMAERAFLAERYKRMPRTMLRYAIEKFPERERKRYLAGKIT
jgi:3-methyladenine DNA glycosylase AlkD